MTQSVMQPYEFRNCIDRKAQTHKSSLIFRPCVEQWNAILIIKANINMNNAQTTPINLIKIYTNDLDLQFYFLSVHCTMVSELVITVCHSAFSVALPVTNNL